MYEAHILYGYSLKDRAEYCGIHYTSVSRRIAEYERKNNL